MAGRALVLSAGVVPLDRQPATLHMGDSTSPSKVRAGSCCRPLLSWTRRACGDPFASTQRQALRSDLASVSVGTSSHYHALPINDAKMLPAEPVNQTCQGDDKPASRTDHDSGVGGVRFRQDQGEKVNERSRRTWPTLAIGARRRCQACHEGLGYTRGWRCSPGRPDRKCCQASRGQDQSRLICLPSMTPGHGGGVNVVAC